MEKLSYQYKTLTFCLSEDCEEPYDVFVSGVVAVAEISEWSRDNARRTTRLFQGAQNALGGRLRSNSVHRLPTEIGLKTLKFCSIIDST